MTAQFSIVFLRFASKVVQFCSASCPDWMKCLAPITRG